MTGHISLYKLARELETYPARLCWICCLFQIDVVGAHEAAWYGSMIGN